MNNVSMTGRAVRDIELRYTGQGKPVANGTMAVQRNFKNQNGEYEADFVDIQIWGKTAEVAANYISKGQKFAVTGRIQTRMYENKYGRNVKSTEVNVNDLDLPERNNSSDNQNSTQQSQGGSDDPFAGEQTDISDSDLPF
ncbi:single-stranded DNA-binding protein [Salibacterium lacus]|uniref:Single-stranded DNA-binding protein n=1 Tax=Salibacterium lacus TaxID=1898109 RepID=A0ABW5SXB8_9BACI